MASKPVILVGGDTWSRVWSLADANDVPLDLTGCSARLHVRDKDGALVMSASLADGRIARNANRLTLTMPAAVTALLAPGAYRFALEVSFSDATVRTIEINTLAIQEDLTHD